MKLYVARNSRIFIHNILVITRDLKVAIETAEKFVTSESDHHHHVIVEEYETDKVMFEPCSGKGWDSNYGIEHTETKIVVIVEWDFTAKKVIYKDK